MPISFNNFHVTLLLRHKWAIRSVIESIAVDNGYRLDNVEYIFCTDDYIVRINKKFLSHNYATDIITFSEENDGALSAEIYIAVDVVRRNAQAYSCPFYHELLRVIFHGILHGVGYDDHSDTEQAVMREKENHYISACLSQIALKSKRGGQ